MKREFLYTIVGLALTCAVFSDIGVYVGIIIGLVIGVRIGYLIYHKPSSQEVRSQQLANLRRAQSYGNNANRAYGL